MLLIVRAVQPNKMSISATLLPYLLALPKLGHQLIGVHAFLYGVKSQEGIFENTPLIFEILGWANLKKIGRRVGRGGQFFSGGDIF